MVVITQRSYCADLSPGWPYLAQWLGFPLYSSRTRGTVINTVGSLVLSKAPYIVGAASTQSGHQLCPVVGSAAPVKRTKIRFAALATKDALNSASLLTDSFEVALDELICNIRLCSSAFADKLLAMQCQLTEMLAGRAITRLIQKNSKQV
jgi:hypothetical protein